MRYVTLPHAGRWPMREVLALYKEQRAEERRQRQQLTLFELRRDVRPPTTATPDSRYREPTLFKVD